MQFEENNYQYCQQDSEPKFEGVPCCLYGDMKECRICRYVKDNLPKKSMKIETTRTPLQSISTFLSMFHIFSHTEEFPQKKEDREKKDFITTRLRCRGTKLVEQEFEVEEVNPEEVNQKKFFKDFRALHTVLGINKQLFLYIISKGT